MRGVALESHLRSVAESGRKILVTYVTGGLGPDWVEVLQAMVAAGADAVEIGIPFSDPVMDGATIQEASSRALALGADPASILDAVARVDVPVPLVLADAGVRGAIIPDIPLEESAEWERDSAEAGVDAVLLAAPVTPDGRLAEICRRSRGFVYGVNLMGVTGERTAMSNTAGVLAKRLKGATDKPVVMGFGISGPEQAAAAVVEADGVVVASALMRMMLDGSGPEQIADAVRDLRRALDRS